MLGCLLFCAGWRWMVHPGPPELLVDTDQSVLHQAAQQKSQQRYMHPTPHTNTNTYTQTHGQGEPCYSTSVCVCGCVQGGVSVWGFGGPGLCMFSRSCLDGLLLGCEGLALWFNRCMSRPKSTQQKSLLLVQLNAHLILKTRHFLTPPHPTPPHPSYAL